MTAEVWDPADYSPNEYWARPLVAGQATPAALDGFRRYLSTPGGYWLAAFGGIWLNTPAKVRRWRAFAARARGGGVDFEVRLAERLYAPWPRTASGAPDYTPGGIAVALASAAELNDTEIAVTQTAGATLEAGMAFSLTGTLWGKRAYLIADAVNNGGGSYDLTIETGLREDMASGAALDFETPGFIATVAGASDLIPSLEGLKRGVASVLFMESPRR